MPQPSPQPGAAEWRRAHRLGFRPRTAGIELGGRFALLVLLLGAVPWELAVEAMRGALRRAALAPQLEIEAVVHAACSWLAAMSLLALGLSMFIAAASGRLGSRVRAGQGRGRDLGRPASFWLRWLIWCVALLVAAFALRGAVAGAARAVAAGEESLMALWGAWAQRVLGVLAALMLAGGILELLGARARTRAAYLRHREAQQRRSGALG